MQRRLAPLSVAVDCHAAGCPDVAAQILAPTVTVLDPVMLAFKSVPRIRPQGGRPPATPNGAGSRRR